MLALREALAQRYSSYCFYEFHVIGGVHVTLCNVARTFDQIISE